MQRREEETPSWRAWWEIERSRFEWVQTGIICTWPTGPDRPVERDPDFHVRLYPEEADLASANEALLGLLDRESNPEVLGTALISLAKMGKDSAKVATRLLPYLSRSEWSCARRR